MPVYGARYRHRDHFSMTSCDPIFPEMEQEFRVLFYPRYFASITKSNTSNKQTNKQSKNKKTKKDCCIFFHSRPYLAVG